jgi:site-specific DNA-methyltransferase (adenine-specific)
MGNNPRERRYQDESCTLSNADATDLYSSWEDPQVIVSDGAYGVAKSGSSWDTNSVEELPSWYERHVKLWSQKSSAGTTLWFWCTEVGWATMHPILKSLGWKYMGFNTWNKGIKHIAGNSNTKRAKSFPAVTEACAHYVKRPTFDCGEEQLTLQQWLRHEWKRAGLNFSEANVACGVSSAATRKWLTKDHHWYPPSPEKFEMMTEYAERKGEKEGQPYFSIDGERPLTRGEYADLFPKFELPSGETNVWNCPPLRSKERIKIEGGTKAFHLNQKPLALMDKIIKASTEPGDLIWEPFGGLCSASVSAKKLGRRAQAAEVDEKIYHEAARRLNRTLQGSGRDEAPEVEKKESEARELNLFMD